MFQYNPEFDILNVYKPLNWTSFDVVNKMKFFIKKQEGKVLKIGHAGTLDPLATGVLIVCIGKATKKISELQELSKTYTGKIFLGVTTPSFDLETELSEPIDIKHITKEIIEQTALQFIGEQDQLPPIYSAVKINGKRAYEFARSGEEVVILPKKITIHDFKVTQIHLPEIHFEITCSKGTYIRAIARDFGAKLNTVAHLSELHRSAIGNYNAVDALKLETGPSKY